MQTSQMKNKMRFFGLATVLFICSSAVAQKATYSPYSQLGIGIPVYNPITAQASMGGSFNALRGDEYINFYNPASYSSYQYMHFQFALEYQSVTATRAGANRRSDLVFFNQLALGMPIIKNRLGFAFGYTPYSNVGYSFSSSEQRTSPDTVNIDYTYEGKGGVDRFFIGFGGNPVKGLSIGFNTYFYLGNIERSKTSYFPDAFGGSNIQSVNNIRVADFGMDYGLQYTINFKDRRDSLLPKKEQKDRFRLTFGATYVLGKKMAARQTSIARYFNGSLVDNFYQEDTIAERQKVKLFLPMSFGGGISFGQPDFWQVVADFNFGMWSQFRYADNAAEPNFSNSYRVSLGAEINPKSGNKKNFLGKITYRIGGRYGTSYLSPGGTPYQEAAISFGLGLPILVNDVFATRTKLSSFFNIGFEYGVMMPGSPVYSREQMARVVFSFNLRNKWFNTNKYL